MSRTDAASSTQLRRAVFSSYLGSLIEFYDFLLYATAAALVFNQVFFSDLDPLVGTVASFGTLFAGYLARPLGGIVFGHFGDRLGRKKMLIITMATMGIASTLVGLLPTYEQVGALAPILLVALRIVQGIALGGEWGGAVLLSAEHATSRRGLWASFTNAGAPSGMVVSTGMLALVAAGTTEAQFLAWGWRIPFLGSIALLALGLFVRMKVVETPVFTNAAPAASESWPLLEVIKRHPKNLLLAIGIGFGAFVAQSAITVFVVSYAVQSGFARGAVLNALVISSTLAVAGILGYSALSDRIGRRPVVMVGALGMAAVAFVLFPLIDTGSWVLLVLAVVLGQAVVHPMMYGPLAALYSEMFGTRTRYTGASLGYQISSTGAGATPLAFAALLAAGASPVMLSAVIAACCLITVLCIWAVKETHRSDLTRPTP
ncbi:MFS transporter [Glycomyces buryatensis]|uniref:MHS family MFS transporter n=1 Tax=Glycomyces buryatensis TaxID=2570927 RepID=A0A4S8Q6T6_9ACTN|nr:MFS transporter [Glycomyces buryatensis]THV36479.1 MHS family MFS transporter [Glycomyces buryatensis]